MALSFVLPPSLGAAKTAARAEVLAQVLSSELKQPANVIVPASYAELETLALSGAAQIFWGPASVCARVERDARAIYKVVRNGHSSYRSVLVRRVADNFNVGRLQGLRAAWVDRLSVGGYLLAVDLLQRRGLDPDRVFQSQTFCGSHPAAAAAVLMGTADVAAVTTTAGDDASIHAALTMYVGPAALRLAPIAITEEAPTDGVVLGASLSEADAAAITARLFPDGLRRRVPSFLLSAMDAEGFVKARPHEYQALLRLMGTSPNPSQSRLKSR